MASELVQVRMPSGSVVWARVTETQRVRDTGAADMTAVLAIEGLPETIASVAESIRMGLHNLRPREVNVEFGIELAARTGKIVSVLAAVGATATVKVQLTWSGEPTAPSAT